MSQYTIRGKGTVNLNQNDFIAEGGQGKVYVKGNTILKIYHNESDMIPELKIQELSVLNKPSIIRPKDIVLNQQNRICGFTMDLVKDGIPICKLFSNDFRTKNSITPDSTVKLVENIKELTDYVHQKGCLIVDHNEVNCLTNKTFVESFFIDVDSYQTKTFPAQAIMDSIRDVHSKSFSVQTDWFSFGILSFQLFVGIHPFKGNYTGGKNSLKDRMMANISALNSNVKLPKMVRDFSFIPSEYMDWYIREFEKGERIPPPHVCGVINPITVVVKLIQSTNNFNITFVQEYPNEIAKCFGFGSHNCVTTTCESYISRINHKSSPNSHIVFLPSMNHVVAEIIGNKLHLLYENNVIPTVVEGSKMMMVDNTLYVKNHDKLIELSLQEFGPKVLTVVKSSWNIMPNSSQVFDGVVYQSVLGKAYLSIPVPEVPISSFFNIAVPELDGYKIIDAKYDNHICVVIGFKKGKYDRLTFKFDDEFKKHKCFLTSDINYHSINFITLPNGTSIHICDENGTLEIMSNDFNRDEKKVIKDPEIDSSVRLCKGTSGTMFFKGNKLFSIGMK